MNVVRKSECMEHLLVYQDCRALTCALARFSCFPFWQPVIAFKLCMYYLFTERVKISVRKESICNCVFITHAAD